MLSLLCSIILSLVSLHSSIGHIGDGDWTQRTEAIKAVSFDSGSSGYCTVWSNNINGSLAVKLLGSNSFYELDWADRPEYRMMFEFKHEKWYISPPDNLSIPDSGENHYVGLVKAVCYTLGSSGYYRLIQNKVTGEYTIRTDDPFFGCIVYNSDKTGYSYMFRSSGFYWYFNL